MYIDIKIGEEKYIQRSEFSKITIIHDNGTKYFADDIEDLPQFQQLIIKSALSIKAEPEKYFAYEESETDPHSLIITDYLKKTKHIVIPDEIDGKKVIGIEKIFYEANNEIESIILPDSIEKIPRAFCDKLPNLKFVQLPSNLTDVPVEAFSKCKHLKYINLKNIKNINSYGFYGCHNLENINTENIESIGPFGFSYCTNLKEINLPNIKHLDGNAFSYCKNLVSIFLGDNLTKINEYTFLYCEALKNIRFSNSLKEIGHYAFCYCSKLSTINLPESLRKIDEGAFADTDLSGILNLPKKLISIGSTAFFVGGLKEVNLSKKTKYKDNTFYEPYVNIKKYENKEKSTPIISEER